MAFQRQQACQFFLLTNQGNLCAFFVAEWHSKLYEDRLAIANLPGYFLKRVHIKKHSSSLNKNLPAKPGDSMFFFVLYSENRNLIKLSCRA